MFDAKPLFTRAVQFVVQDNGRPAETRTISIVQTPTGERAEDCGALITFGSPVNEGVRLTTITLSREAIVILRDLLHDFLCNCVGRDAPPTGEGKDEPWVSGPKDEEARILDQMVVDANAAVHGIIEDLTDRRGLRQTWAAMDEETRTEIRKTWATIIGRSGV
jgi:hypothetical protein